MVPYQYCFALKILSSIIDKAAKTIEPNRSHGSALDQYTLEPSTPHHSIVR
jgi:hypothetical protein